MKEGVVLTAAVAAAVAASVLVAAAVLNALDWPFSLAVSGPLLI